MLRSIILVGRSSLWDRFLKAWIFPVLSGFSFYRLYWDRNDFLEECLQTFTILFDPVLRCRCSATEILKNLSTRCASRFLLSFGIIFCARHLDTEISALRISSRRSNIIRQAHTLSCLLLSPNRFIIRWRERLWLSSTFGIKRGYKASSKQRRGCRFV